MGYDGSIINGQAHNIKLIMKKLLVFIFLLSCLSAFGQVSKDFGGRLIVGPITPTGGKYIITASFTDDYGYYTSDSLQLGDIVMQNFGTNCYCYEVDSIISKTGGVINARLNPKDGGVMQSVTSAVFRPTTNYGFVHTINGLPPTLLTCIQHYMEIQTDDAISTAVAGAGDNGNILYVSTTGNNSTAVKGNPNKAWRDPWAAKYAASPNDYIVIYPGEWTYGDTSCTTCYYAVETYDSLNLMKDSLTFYAYPGVKFKNTDSWGYLFHATTPMTTHFYGKAEFEISTANAFVFLSNDSINFTLEAHSFIANDEAGWHRGLDIEKANKVDVHFDYVETVTYRFMTTAHGSGNLLKNADIKVTIDNVYDDKGHAFIMNYGALDSCNIFIHIKNLRQDIAFECWGYRNYKKNSNYYIKIDNATIYRETENTRFGAPWINGIFGSYSPDIYMKNSIITYEYGNLITDLSLINVVGHNATIPDTNSMVVFTGNAVHTNPDGSFIGLRGSNNNYGTNVKIVGDYISNGVPIYTSENRNTWTLTGKFATTKDSTSVVNISHANPYIIFQDARFINDGTVASISSSVTDTIICLGAYTNSLIIDPDVTELVSPIVRNPEIR